MTSTLCYTSDVQHDARRAAAAARREAVRAERTARAEAAFAAEFPHVLAIVAEEGDCFGVKVRSTTADWRASGWTAEMVARLILDPETDVEYWPIADES